MDISWQTSYRRKHGREGIKAGLGEKGKGGVEVWVVGSFFRAL